MSQLYLRLPPSNSTDDLADGRHLSCRYALVASGKVERDGVASLSELSATLPKVERVTLLLAATDVVLLRLKIPPLSPSRLNVALPNLVEDHIIGDPAECAIAAGAASADGMRTVGVVQRAWLEKIAKALAQYGVHRVSAVPAQLCLPCPPSTASVVVQTEQEEVQLTIRLSEHEGFGIAMPTGSSARDVLETVSAVARDARLMLWVPDHLMQEYRGAVDALPAQADRITLASASWSCWLDGTDSIDVNLLSGLNVAYLAQDRAWRQWRWPAALAAGVLTVNLIGLYVDWWQLKSESDRLRAAMVQTFRSTYPHETVILDPLAQMKQKVAQSRRASGELAPDDFLVQLSAFAEAWTRVAPQRTDGTASPIAAVEFRDRSLVVRTDADMPGAIASDLRTRGFDLTRSGAGTWQLRSMK